MEKIKKIIHIDMDYFYAQVEERENPSLKNLPVGIGGLSSRGGILCTCNYIARDFGVRSAMPTFKAKKLCPDLVMITPNFKLYKEASEEVFKIFSEYTDLVEGISIDEAYLDVTESSACQNSATLIAREIKNKIYHRTGLTASAGISYNKLLAKIASEYNKPNGILTVTPEMTPDFIKELSVNKINGVGTKTYERMQKLNLNTFGDLQKKSIYELEGYFGIYGRTLYDYAHGRDFRTVKKERERKSLSVERTFMNNILEIDSLKSSILDIFEEMQRRLKKHDNRSIKSIFVKLKFNDFSQTTIETQSSSTELDKFLRLLEQSFGNHTKPVRLIGVGVKFHPDIQFSKQLYLPCCA